MRYSEMRSEKFGNPARSGYNKGTIRSDIWYLAVTAEVASSSLVVPAIHSHTQKSSTDFHETSEGAKGPVSVPFFVPLFVLSSARPINHLHAANSPDTDECDVPFRAKTPTTRRLPELHVWQA